VQDTILKIVSCIFKTQDSIISGILRHLFIVSYLGIFKILFTKLGKWKILFQDTFPQILYLAQKSILPQLHIKQFLTVTLYWLSLTDWRTLACREPTSDADSGFNRVRLIWYLIILSAGVFECFVAKHFDAIDSCDVNLTFRNFYLRQGGYVS